MVVEERSLGETESLGMVGAYSTGNAGRRQITTGLVHQCFRFTLKAVSWSSMLNRRRNDLLGGLEVVR